jgi:microcystin-dependent protein
MLQLKNNAYGLLNDTIGSGDAVPFTLTMTAGHGARFPSLSAGQHFVICLTDDPPTKMELMLVTARSTDDVTVSARALGGTTAQNWAANARVSIRWDMMQALEFERLGGGNSYITSAGTASAITGSISTLLQALYDGLGVVVEMSGSTGPNTITNPTFALTFDATSYGSSTVNTGAKTIVQPDGTALEVGMIGGANTLMLLRWSVGLDKWMLMNPLPTRIVPTGATFDYVGASAPTGYVMLSGRTIGSPTSGATERANADTAALFTLLWDSMADAQAPVSGGRGASAAADFAANKTLTLPDARGRVLVGKDNMGGSAANRITSGGSGVNGATLGASGGAETHTLTTAQLAAHAHGPGAGTHFLNYTLGGPSTVAGGAVYTQTNSTATANAGSGEAHNNVQPALVMNKIVKL